MAQAHRIKTEPPAIRVGILHFIHRLLREIGFWLLATVALGMLIALATFSPEDPAWTHTANVTQLHNVGGAVGAWFADVSLYFFGYPACLLPLGMAFGSWRLFRRGALLRLDGEIVLLRVLGFVVTLTTACGLAALHLQPWPETLPSASGSAGGLVGDHVSQFLIHAFEFAGANLFMLALLLAGFTLATGFSWLIALDWIGQAALTGLDWVGGLAMAPFRRMRPQSPLDTASGVAEPTAEILKGTTPLSPAMVAPLATDGADTGHEFASDAQAIAMHEPLSDRGEPRQEPELKMPVPSIRGNLSGSEMLTLVPTAAPAKTAPVGQQTVLLRSVSPDRSPPLHLLDNSPASTTHSAEVLDHISRRVEILLKHFGVAAKVIAVESGPVITHCEIEPSPGTNISRISSLSSDLARGLSVSSVRVVETIPGKTTIGLEIPNRRHEVIHLREILETPAFTQSASPMPLALGKDSGGHPMVAHLAKMPHLLIAGSIGSGKSAVIHTILLSLLYKASASELRLILIDPEERELSYYKSIPHLWTPVIMDARGTISALRWCVGEAERRRRLMATLKVRNIAGFNRKLSDAQATGSGKARLLRTLSDGGETASTELLPEPLPLIVIAIAELAGLMAVVGKKMEEWITQLAQKAHVAGIHLILATQRPSASVITGLIKANIPSRIALQTSSQADSRLILDQIGAEQLLEQGDMLYLLFGADAPQRVLGAFVSDPEIARVTDYLRQTGAPDYRHDVLTGPHEDSAA